MDDYSNYIPEPYSTNELFDRAEVDLGGESKPEIRFILTIIRSAFEEKDLEYFLGDTFKYHCYLAGLDSDMIVETIVKKKLIEKKRKSVYIRRNSQAVRDDIIYKHEIEGLTAAELAEEYDISYKTVKKLLNPLYSPMVNYKGQRENIIKDYLDGMKIKAMEQKYEMSDSSIYRALKGISNRT